MTGTMTMATTVTMTMTTTMTMPMTMTITIARRHTILCYTAEDPHPLGPRKMNLCVRTFEKPLARPS
eukprot:4016188-Lingulodinium_polyedra.AAC.1